MGSSAKKKKEKKKDFQKPKLKVGKARPKNTNATDTSFTAKSIVIKQQSLSESTRDRSALFNHNLSLLSSKNEPQRRDCLAFLTSHVTAHQDNLPQSAPTILSKALPLLLDGNSTIRSQLLKLVRALPSDQIGSLDAPLLYIRAGLTHLSVDIRLNALDLLDWLVEIRGAHLVSLAGGWIKLLRTFQILLAWEDVAPSGGAAPGKWSSTKSSTTMGNSKLVVHQLNTLTAILSCGLIDDKRTSSAIETSFPYCHLDAHTLPTRSNVYGYLNLFGKPRDMENEMYESNIERREVFVESGLRDAFVKGSDNAKKEGGETGRAAAGIIKILKLLGSD